MLIGMYSFAHVFFLVIITSFSFADRDMFMRYFGGGVGHLGQGSSRTHWKATEDVHFEGQEPQPELEEHPEPMPDSDEELDEVPLEGQYDALQFDDDGEY
jgi:hypothetical protein